AYPPGAAAVAPAPAAAPSARQADSHRTQLFGSSGAPPVPAPRPGSAPPLPSAPSAPDRPSTQMFGAPAPPAPAAPAPRNHTQMFGATASDTIPGAPWGGLKPRGT